MKLLDVCEALNISDGRVEQWISRRLFATGHDPRPGQARVWTRMDAVRLAAMAQLVDAGVDLESAGVATQIPLDAEVLILWTGVAPIGGTRMKNPPKMPIHGFHSRQIDLHEMRGFIADPDITTIIAINLENLRDRVRDALERVA